MDEMRALSKILSPKKEFIVECPLLAVSRHWIFSTVPCTRHSATTKSRRALCRALAAPVLFFAVLVEVPDAWIDEKKTKTGYEINFTKYFYEFKPLRTLAEIKADILALEESGLELEKTIMEN